jgi:hypothetical protein
VTEPLIGTALVIRPGDRVLIGFSERYTAEQAAHVQGQLREHLPGVKVAFIGPVTAMAVYRGEEDDVRTATGGQEA